jgi:hypothetical protein
MVFMFMTACGGWAVYVSAQELQDLLATPPGSESQDALRYQFVDHFFMQNGSRYEIFLRLDRATGQTWRFHASQPGWTEIDESAESLPSTDGKENRFELMSHVYNDEGGNQHELFLRVDFVDGRSWKYKGMDKSWTEIEVPGTPAPEQVTQDPVSPAAE